MAKETREQQEPRDAKPTATDVEVARQVDAALNAPLIFTPDALGPSLRLLWPDLVLDPLVRPRRVAHKPLRFSAWAALDPHPIRTLVVGDPRTGKSTLLRKLFLETAAASSSALI